MKRKIFDIIVIVITLFILYQIMIKKVLVYNSVSYALNLWVKNLIPTLFPFFIISDILINYNFTYYIPKTFKKICKYLFNITDNMITILILSIISGFPSNARNTRILYDKGLITLDEANHILIFSHFANPLFILTTVGTFFFKNKRIGIILLISHYLSNFILGIMFRKYFSHMNSITVSEDNKINFGNIFVNAIKKSIDTILLICGIVTIFMLLSSIINNTFNFNIYNSMIVKGLLEITIGIEALSNMNLSIIYKAVIASCFLAFGGFSVHMQVMGQITGTKIKYRYFFVGRIYQIILSAIITFIICLFLV
ncbi:MAG: hypothetical protein IJE89_06030 [Bacilli bacterium]|nr:hypothetical protein [Bacilli bacterium]